MDDRSSEVWKIDNMRATGGSGSSAILVQTQKSDSSNNYTKQTPRDENILYQNDDVEYDFGLIPEIAKVFLLDQTAEEICQETLRVTRRSKK